MRALPGIVLVALTLGGAAPATAQVGAPPVEDYGGVRNVLAVGQGRTVNAIDLAVNQAAGRIPPEFTNQLRLYRDVLYAAPSLQRTDLDRFFKPAGFGVAGGDVTSAVRPRPGVEILRDAYAVPHVFGTTRADTMFGTGYASAQDRLFTMDVLRHYGRGRVSELAGPGANDSNVALDVAQVLVSGYSEDELQAMIDSAAARAGAEGARARQDLLDYTAGVNHYIRQARLDPRLLPAEYVALGKMPADWKPTDSVAVASLIGGIFGRGGGKEHLAGDVLARLQQRFGARRGRRLFDDFRRAEDPEAPVTVHRRFRFDDPGPVDRRAVALPEAGSVRARNPILSGSDIRIGSRSRSVGLDLASNVMLLGGARSASRRPVAVMGPQVEWYSPQILMELDVHGPGIHARGAAFPGISFLILLGRGPDFAWSATTATTDVVDVFAERLCSPGGGRPTTATRHYLRHGRCIPMLRREHVLQTTTSAGNPRPPRTIRMEILRTVHGPVTAFGKVDGRPVAFAENRSTFKHELESTLAFERLNSGEVRDARSFQRTMSFVNFAFNWFYADDRDIAFLNSGWYPRRAPGVDPSLPAWGTGRWDWRRWDASTNLSARLAFASLPKAVNPGRGYIVNWNNKQAPGWRAADDQWAYGSVFRSTRLEDPLRSDLRRGKVDLTRLVQIHELATTMDVRGRELYPLLRAVIGRSSGDTRLDALLAVLDRWRASGAHRRDLDRDNVLEDSAAVALMDAWEPRYTRAIFSPVLGSDVVTAIEKINPITDTPRYNKGSGFGSGWYGYVQKDLRTLLGRRVRDPLSRRYCGRGRRSACRRTLLATLRDAGADVARAQGTDDPVAWRLPATCEPLESGDPLPKRCDQIEFQTLGAIETPPIPWQDRPTFEQVVEFHSHRPR